MDSAINVGLTAYNIDNIGIKAMVKKTAKQTGQTILEDYKIAGSSEVGPAGRGAVGNVTGGAEEPPEEPAEELEQNRAKKREK